mmetsp:Transcript_23448/g.58676  ORF Transcript_23448/g.58676 Transcript_23448/m.58676 type:complete len:377 (+) Transcript_23448:442-1572(+)
MAGAGMFFMKWRRLLKLLLLDVISCKEFHKLVSFSSSSAQLRFSRFMGVMARPLTISIMPLRLFIFLKVVAMFKKRAIILARSTALTRRRTSVITQPAILLENCTMVMMFCASLFWDFLAHFWSRNSLPLRAEKNSNSIRHSCSHMSVSVNMAMLMAPGGTSTGGLGATSGGTASSCSMRLRICPKADGKFDLVAVFRNSSNVLRMGGVQSSGSLSIHIFSIAIALICLCDVPFGLEDFSSLVSESSEKCTLSKRRSRNSAGVVKQGKVEMKVSRNGRSVFVTRCHTRARMVPPVTRVPPLASATVTNSQDWTKSTVPSDSPLELASPGKDDVDDDIFRTWALLSSPFLSFFLNSAHFLVVGDGSFILSLFPTTTE